MPSMGRSSPTSWATHVVAVDFGATWHRKGFEREDRWVRPHTQSLLASYTRGFRLILALSYPPGGGPHSSPSCVVYGCRSP
jgi:hypothetical protein